MKSHLAPVSLVKISGCLRKSHGTNHGGFDEESHGKA
jgi:hypothetical protein